MILKQQNFAFVIIEAQKNWALVHNPSLCQQVKVLPALSPGPSGSLIVEPLRNVSHEVHHKVCEGKLIQRALAERFLSAQNLQRGKEFFQSSHKHNEALMAQQEHFVQSMVWKQVTGYDWLSLQNS